MAFAENLAAFFDTNAFAKTATYNGTSSVMSLIGDNAPGADVERFVAGLPPTPQ